MALEYELDTYRRELRRLLEEGHAGRWALIKGDEVVSVWDTQRDVLQAGHEHFGLEPFAVKHIDVRDEERLAILKPVRRPNARRDRPAEWGRATGLTCSTTSTRDLSGIDWPVTWLERHLCERFVDGSFLPPGTSRNGRQLNCKNWPNTAMAT